MMSLGLLFMLTSRLLIYSPQVIFSLSRAEHFLGWGLRKYRMGQLDSFPFSQRKSEVDRTVQRCMRTAGREPGVIRCEIFFAGLFVMCLSKSHLAMFPQMWRLKPRQANWHLSVHHQYLELYLEAESDCFWKCLKCHSTFSLKQTHTLFQDLLCPLYWDEEKLNQIRISCLLLCKFLSSSASLWCEGLFYQL